MGHAKIFWPENESYQYNLILVEFIVIIRIHVIMTFKLFKEVLTKRERFPAFLSHLKDRG